MLKSIIYMVRWSNSYTLIDQLNRLFRKGVITKNLIFQGIKTKTDFLKHKFIRLFRL